MTGFGFPLPVSVAITIARTPGDTGVSVEVPSMVLATTAGKLNPELCACAVAANTIVSVLHTAVRRVDRRCHFACELSACIVVYRFPSHAGPPDASECGTGQRPIRRGHYRRESSD